MSAKSNKITFFLPNLTGGGAERVSINLANHFLLLGYEIDFILCSAHGKLLPLLDSRIVVIDLKVSRLRHSIKPLTCYLKNNKPEALIAIMWPLTIIAVIAHFMSGNNRNAHKVFVSDHTLLSLTKDYEGWLKKIFLKWSIRLVYPLASNRLAVSKGVANDIVNLSSLSKKTEFQVIYNPIEFPSGSDIIEKKLSQFRIITVGSFKPVKDHKTLILAFEKVLKKVNAELVILGEGPLQKELTDFIASLGLSKHISLPGFKTDLLPWYASADLFVLSSRFEGFGNVIVEAMACGVSVVSTNCPSGPAEILENGKYGKLVPVGDVDALAQAMLESLQEKHDVNTLKKRAADFSLDKIAKQYLKVIFPNEVLPEQANGINK